MNTSSATKRHAKRHLARFESVKEFFKSWGMYPDGEHSDMLEDRLNPDAIANGINRKCYEKLIEQAYQHIWSSEFSNYFPNFCREIIAACDNQFYLKVSTWQELEKAWDNYIDSL